MSHPEYTLQYGDFIAVPLTTVPQRESGYALRHWAEAGLPKKTWVKPVVNTLLASLVERELGRLSSVDYKNLYERISQLICSPRGLRQSA